MNNTVVNERIICEKPFWVDPLGLFTNFSFKYCSKCRYQIWNFIARLAILAIVASGVFVAAGYGPVIVPVVVSLVSVFGSIILLSRAGSPWGNSERGGSRWKTLPSIEVVMPEGDDNSSNAAPRHQSPQTPGEKAKAQDDAMMQLAEQTEKWVESQAYARGYDQVDIGPADHDDQIKTLEDKAGTSSEGFMNMNMNGNSCKLATSGIGAAPYTASQPIPDYAPPAARNPFMNILLDEYKYNPTRPAAAPVTDPLVKSTLDDFFRVQWFSDPTDVFGRNQSQRQFISQPVTSIPNDQKSFQEWLYKIPGKTCKEGGRTACLAGTDGSPVTWLNQEF